MTARRGTTPIVVRASAAAFALHALAAAVLAAHGGRAGAAAPLDGRLVAGTTLLAAVGIWRARRWGWWLGVTGGGLLLSVWIGALVLVGRLSGDRPALPAPAVGGALAALLLALGVGLLLLPGARAVFRGRADGPR